MLCNCSVESVSAETLLKIKTSLRWSSTNSAGTSGGDIVSTTKPFSSRDGFQCRNVVRDPLLRIKRVAYPESSQPRVPDYFQGFHRLRPVSAYIYGFLLLRTVLWLRKAGVQPFGNVHSYSPIDVSPRYRVAVNVGMLPSVSRSSPQSQNFVLCELETASANCATRTVSLISTERGC